MNMTNARTEWDRLTPSQKQARIEADQAHIAGDSAMPTDTTTRLAAEFTRLVRERFTPDQLAEIDRRNATAEYRDAGACATQDFADANEIMAEAFETVTGRAFDFDGDMDADAPLWNEAWDLARNAGFSPKPTT